MHFKWQIILEGFYYYAFLPTAWEKCPFLYTLTSTWHSLFCQYDRWKCFVVLVCIYLLVQLSTISCLTICISYLNHLFIFYLDFFFKAYYLPFNQKRLSWGDGLSKQHKGLPDVELRIRQKCSHRWHCTNALPPSISVGDPALVKATAWRSSYGQLAPKQKKKKGVRSAGFASSVLFLNINQETYCFHGRNWDFGTGMF